MTIASEVVTSALKRANIIGVNQTPSDGQMDIGLELLNDWIAELKNDGLDLQLEALGSTDDIYLDASDVPCLKSNLTVLVADYYKLAVPQGVQRNAIQSLDNLRGKSLEADTEEMDLPDVLMVYRKSDIRTG